MLHTKILENQSTGPREDFFNGFDILYKLSPA